MTRTVYVMAKAPIMGRVKTRLGADIGMVEAIRFYRRTLNETARALAQDKRWQTILAVTPDVAADVPQYWPPRIARQEQGVGSLGARMARLLRTAPPGDVLITGSDIPDITPKLIARAFRDLGHGEAIIGPSDDGGYWLIGLAARARHLYAVGDSLLAGVRWSSPHALNDTLLCLKNRDVILTKTLVDIDTGEDYVRWCAKK